MMAMADVVVQDADAQKSGLGILLLVGAVAVFSIQTSSFDR